LILLREHGIKLANFAVIHIDKPGEPILLGQQKITYFYSDNPNSPLEKEFLIKAF